MLVMNQSEDYRETQENRYMKNSLCLTIRVDWSINQSINNQSINQSINQSMDYECNEIVTLTLIKKFLKK